MKPGFYLERDMTPDQIAVYIDECTCCIKFVDNCWCEVVVEWVYACNWCWAPTEAPDFVWQVYVDLCTDWMYKAVWTDVSARNKFL